MSLVEIVCQVFCGGLALVAIWMLLFFAVQVGVGLWRANREKGEE